MDDMPHGFHVSLRQEGDLFLDVIEKDRIHNKRHLHGLGDACDPVSLRQRVEKSEVVENGPWRGEDAYEILFPKGVDTVFDPDGEAALYLRALADTRVFFEKEIDVTSLKKILKSAIEAEKDSIVFYLGMKEAVPEKLGKGRLDDIIREEME